MSEVFFKPAIGKRTYWAIFLAVLADAPVFVNFFIPILEPVQAQFLGAVARACVALGVIFARHGAQQDAEAVNERLGTVAETTAKHLEESGEPAAAATVRKRPVRKKAEPKK